MIENKQITLGTWLELNLPTVQKPGRYAGNELNQVRKDWDSVQAHVALAFPDLYDLGLPNLGLAILYDQINKRQDTLAERVYLPWVDMETIMRRDGIPLFSLENQRSLNQFDLIGITLPYETLYTNALNLLDLGGIPVLSKDRSDAHPLVIAGGHAMFNPEPMAPFLDAVVIGEGEEVIQEILDAVIAAKSKHLDRTETLVLLSRIAGIYIPAFYSARYDAGGRYLKLDTIKPDAPDCIQKRILGRLPEPVTDFIVPSIEVVHNRVAIEIMRGCTRGCRFCQAGMITRPVRERPVSQILDSLQVALDKTGFEEVALLSLSSSDHSEISEIVAAIQNRFAGKHLTISLPSLRIESLSVDLLEKLSGSRQTSFTLAPEAATDRLRNIINKPISDEALLDVTRLIYSRGWRVIKCYFMIGHPEETMEDVRAIADLCIKVVMEGRKFHGLKATLHAGISTFIPKPHTPFQWRSMDSLESIREKQSFLRNALRGPGLKMTWADPQTSLLEAWLSRGDRRTAEAIFDAWKAGARFDAWQDQFDFNLWKNAFEQAGIDPFFYSHRTRSAEEVFPWDHIHIGVSKKYLLEEAENSVSGVLRPDCRENCYVCGILPDYKKIRKENPGNHWGCPEVKSEVSVP
jgi:radical SAM family uncharacterized protein